jgi:hypothetical protein
MTDATNFFTASDNIEEAQVVVFEISFDPQRNLIIDGVLNEV